MVSFEELLCSLVFRVFKHQLTAIFLDGRAFVPRLFKQVVNLFPKPTLRQGYIEHFFHLFAPLRLQFCDFIQIHGEAHRLALLAHFCHQLVVSAARQNPRRQAFHKALERQAVVVVHIPENREIYP